jgi:hypothetical protein
MKGLRECSPLFFGAIFFLNYYPICAFCAIYGEKAAQWLTPSVSPFGPLRISQSYMPGTNHSPDCTSFKNPRKNLSSELTASFYVS